MPADPGLLLLATAAPAPLLPPAEILALVLTGLGAGMLGGLLGIGGSIIMIPVLTLGFSHDQHLSQAAAMIVNVVVAVSSYSQHRRAGAIPVGTVPRLVPAAILAIILGVVASNHFDGTGLQRIFGVFLVLVVAMNIQRLVHRSRRGSASAAAIDEDATGPPRVIPAVIVAGIVGGSAGLLGIGGGIIAVPLCQRVLGMPIRASIAASATLMCLTAPVGAVLKNLSLPPGQSATDAVLIAGVLAPTAIVGSLLGARLTHVLPTLWLRAALVFLLSWAAVKFLGLA
ncbi:MAG: sulfite exporter TauE/SafE family protein [Planctomycetota bacterium]|jgi:uncharacterized membrane protein YfcA